MLHFNLVHYCNHSDVLKDILYSSILNVGGQFVIYSMIEKHMDRCVNIARKLLSIVISLFNLGSDVTMIRLFLDKWSYSKKKSKLN